MNIICLDTEFTGIEPHNEILELSIYDSYGGEIFHELFKPEKATSWANTEKIHGITPKMVEDKPSFKERRREIQEIFDGADLIVGFAVNNDLRVLSNVGVQRLNMRRAIDVRELYWRCRGIGEITLNTVPNLVKCSTECGFHWNNTGNKAHRASADTKATLYTYHVLMEELSEIYNLTDEAEIIAKLREDIASEKLNQKKLSSKAYIYLWKNANDVYTLSVKHDQLTSHQFDKQAERGFSLVYLIQVEDKWRALYDLYKKFTKRRIGYNKLNLSWNLKDKEIEYFSTYSNFYDEKSMLYKMIIEKKMF